VPSTAQPNSNRPSSRSIGYPIFQTNRGVFPLVKWACGPFVDEGEGGPRGDALLSDEPSVGPAPNGVELKAERRKPSGEKSCDIEDIPSLTGVLAHFRLHEFNAIRACPGCGGLIRVSEVRALPRELSSEFELWRPKDLTPGVERSTAGRFLFLSRKSKGFASFPRPGHTTRCALCSKRDFRSASATFKVAPESAENRSRTL
jgi:hypothetical protein